MHTISYIGPEMSAAGYRLAGAVCHIPPPGAEAAALDAACAGSRIVLLSARTAASVDSEILHRRLAALHPFVLVVPELDGDEGSQDAAARACLLLGTGA